jgi:hypothetical protein
MTKFQSYLDFPEHEQNLQKLQPPFQTLAYIEEN